MKSRRSSYPFYSKFAFGIGLGMTIVKRIVDEHGFKMEIKSEKILAPR